MKSRLHIFPFAAIALALLLPKPSSAITGYRSPSEFDSAALEYTNHAGASFDDVIPGALMSTYRGTDITVSGLNSAGTSGARLRPIATDSYPAQSGLIALGNSNTYGDQFLSGNSDTIEFVFPTPIYAFGLYLVGNPSPTGSKPIVSFWRMEIVSEGNTIFTTTSGITPYATLGEGNDVYFLGVVSEQSQFDTVQVYSDNDPNAVFSFNIDSLVYASLPDEVSLLQAKTLSSGNVRVRGIVTRVHSDRFNIETADRTTGIAVLGTGATRGNEISVKGLLGQSSDSERIVESSKIMWQIASTPPSPFYMNSLSVGGSTQVGMQFGIPGSLGPNNIGLDGAITGTITAIAPDYTWISVDDGCKRPLINGATGVIVVGQTNAATRSIGNFVTVRGSITQMRYNGTTLPAIRVALPGDIIP